MKQMMREASQQLSVWRKRHRAAGELTVAVNLSTGEIDRPDLVADVQESLEFEKTK